MRETGSLKSMQSSSEKDSALDTVTLVYSRVASGTVRAITNMHYSQPTKAALTL